MAVRYPGAARSEYAKEFREHLDRCGRTGRPWHFQGSDPRGARVPRGAARRIRPRRTELLALRKTRRDAVADGARLDFLDETASVREGDWTVAPVPAYLADRRVEITGPTDRKMTINAMNSGAKVWLADMEDANTPHWGNVIDGQVNLADAIRGTITLEQGGKSYALSDGERASS